MNFKTTLILIALLAVAGIAMLSTRDKKGISPDAMSEPAKVVGMKADEIIRVAIAPAAGKKVVLERDGVRWKLTAPVTAPAETFAAQDLADALARLESKGSVPASTAGTGVDKPQFTVEVENRDRKTVSLAIGERSAAGSNLYVKKEGGDTVLVVPADLYDQLDKPVKDFRRKKLLDVATAEVRQLKVTSPEQALALQKTTNDWQMTSPAQIPADEPAVSNLITAVGNLQAVEFVDDADADASAGKMYGFDSPAYTVELSTAAPATRPSTQPVTQPATTRPAPSSATVVKFGRFDDIRKRNVYITVDGVIAKVAASSLDALRKSPLDLRDRRVLNIDPATVTRVSLKVDKPATTQPTTRPAETREVVISRRKRASRLGPDFPATSPTTAPATATTSPTTAPTLAATTGPATAPAEAETKWVVSVDGQESAAGDTHVDSLLHNLRPLRAEKYVILPPVGTADRYSLKVETPSQNYDLAVSEVAGGTAGQSAIGDYDGILFEVAPGLLSDLKADFTKPAPNPPEPSTEP